MNTATTNRRPKFSKKSAFAKHIHLGAASLLALCLGMQAAPAWAQDEVDSLSSEAGAPGTVETEAVTGDEITVTGTRIGRSGYDAPTPVNVLTAADIESSAPGNIADFVNTLPAISGSSTPASSTGSLSGGSAGINSINLRGLGTSRTLVLLDGQRSVASTATGLVDINTFPQALIQRVEVVTGGASAAYGSDAVGGVVNFILDKTFTGFELKGQYGLTSRNDAESYQVTAKAGLSLLDDRLHIIASGEYYNIDGIHTIDRDWAEGNFLMMNNPYYAPGNGRPERYVGFNVGPSNVTPGGLIVSGPLEGTYFGAIDPATGRATTGQLTFGDVSGPWMIGGDLDYTSSNYVNISSLLPGQERIGGFARASFDLTPEIEIFGQYSYTKDKTYSVYIQSINSGNLTIRQDNAFLPESVRQEMIDNGLTSIRVGTSNAGIPPGTATNVREVFRTVIGSRGDFELFGNDWSFDLYYQHGKAEVNENLIYTWNNARIANATDAVYTVPGDTSSPIACRINVDANAANDDPSCVPLNRIGVGGVTQAALDYVLGEPYRLQYITQDVAALTFNTTLFELPAGPVSIAFGGEWRKEKIDGFVEAQYVTGWQYGNYRPNVGEYTVKEAFAEIAIPVFDGFDFNAAGRYTSYSTSGDVQTWKLGATYTPIYGVKFRGTVSHDIRAPNLDELFAAGTGRSNTVIIDGQSVAYQQLATGNPNLKPETADSWTVGSVIQPEFMPGFAFSADYYEVKITDAIGSIEPQDVADLCYLQNVQEQCANITTLTGGLLQIALHPFNFSSQLARGIDFEASYQTDLDLGAISGRLTLRGMATRYLENTLDNGLDFPNDNAGANARGFGPPDWQYRASLIYDADPITFSLTGRGVSAGVYDNSYVECEFDCPASTVEHITLNNNHIDGQFVLDTSLSYALNFGGLESELQLTVLNLLDSDPALAARGPTGNSAPSFAQTNPAYYDFLGRRYRLTLTVRY